jgi:hypothetical protein
VIKLPARVARPDATRARQAIPPRVDRGESAEFFDVLSKASAEESPRVVRPLIPLAGDLMIIFNDHQRVPTSLLHVPRHA